MLTIAVCDDNPRFAHQLAAKLRELCALQLPDRIDCSIAPAFGSGEDVLRYLQDHIINILFLDIDMPEMNGFIQLLLPYGFILNIYKRNKAIPTNIKTKSGRNLKAIMITDKYGVIFTEDIYIENRLHKLRQKQKQVDALNSQLANEINSLSFQAREIMFNGED